jgi:hypothetical protein
MPPTTKDWMIAVFTAKVESPEVLKTVPTLPQFGVRISVPRSAQFIGAQALPSIIDMLGFTTNNGPMGFSYLFNPTEPCESRLVVLVKPNLPLGLIGGAYGGWWHGVAQMLGGLRALVEFVSDDAHNVSIHAEFPIFDSIKYERTEMEDLLR